MTKEELIKLSRENLRKSKQGSLCECYDEAFIKGYELSEKQIDDLEKENAELNEKYDSCLRENTGLKIHSAFLEKKLTKAKEIIKLLLWDLRNRSYEPVKDVEQAEQFLNSEVSHE